MKHNVKITKREMKEDKFTTFILLAKDYVTERWQFVAGGVAAVVIIIGAIILMQSQQGKKDAAAMDIYNRAMGELRSGNSQLAIVDFKSIVDDYGSTSHAKMAAFNLANAYFAARNYPEAKTAFENYLDKYSDSEYFMTSAMAGIADCLAGTEDFKAAADKYREIAEKYPDFKLTGEYYLKALQNYIKANEMESAKVTLAKITNDFKDTQYFMDGTRLAAEHGLRL